MWQQHKWGVFRERAADGHHAAQFEVLLPWTVRYKVWVPRLNFAQALGIVHCGQGLDFDVRALILGMDQGPGPRRLWLPVRGSTIFRCRHGAH